MELPKADDYDRRLSLLCQHVATICCSNEFKKLHKEMSRIYRRNGLRDATRIAFQDSLFSIYLEQVQPEAGEELLSP
ncbi:hypothetical protein BEP19_07685 [Ammoniphilus oxalaticus]|uniref:Uncharacterized protein n=1 Tax=Ammoniphilus oxalaticus TaxID=66863 RepID=A0A419SJX2_9BACL|nr:hypothetical protein [Ammoniphilus oxalaticus]RKD24275.1 hypothetical protein BEP19_07685 [Ammoniphilus oxalaticus]